jgi:hypothetical protein
MARYACHVSLDESGKKRCARQLARATRGQFAAKEAIGMTNMFNPITALLSPEMFAEVGQRLGIPVEQVQQGIDLAIPLITRGVADVAGTPEGQVAIADAIKNADAGVLGNLSGFMHSFALDSGDDVLTKLFGDEARVVTAGLKDVTGFDIGPVLGMVAPLVLGFLNSVTRKEELDTNGLVKRLKSQARSFERSKSESAVLVEGVFTQVEEVRKLKGRFSATEWQTLRSAPLAAALEVIEAAPSSANRRADELAAAVAAIGEAGQHFAPMSLLAALFYNGAEDVQVGAIGDPSATIQAAVALMERAAPGEATAYKQLLISTAYAAAQAAKEGGFIGVGARQVNKAEQSVIDQLAATLGVS